MAIHPEEKEAEYTVETTQEAELLAGKISEEIVDVLLNDNAGKVHVGIQVSSVPDHSLFDFEEEGADESGGDEVKTAVVDTGGEEEGRSDNESSAGDN